LPIKFNHPIGTAWLAINVEEMVEVWVRDGIAFVCGEAALS
jgi:hypothetical protein